MKKGDHDSNQKPFTRESNAVTFTPSHNTEFIVGVQI